MNEGARPVALPFSDRVICARCGVTLQKHADVYGRWIECEPAPQECAVPSGGFSGMTLRDCHAGQALIGLLASGWATVASRAAIIAEVKQALRESFLLGIAWGTIICSVLYLVLDSLR